MLKEEEDEWVEAHPNGTAEEKAKRLLPLLRLKVNRNKRASKYNLTSCTGGLHWKF